MPIQTVPEDAGIRWRECAGASDLTLLYKHSPICWVAGLARAHVVALAADHPALVILEVDVLAQERLSRQIAAELGITHASPQVILLRHGHPVWSASHLQIDGEALVAALAR